MSTFTQTNTKRTTFTMEERKTKAQRAQSWNGKQKHGSYARHRQVIATAAAERQTFRDAEAAGEFVCVRRGRNKSAKATVAPTMPRILSRFAALADSDDEKTSQLPVITTPTKKQTEPTPVTPKQVTWGPAQKSAPVAPTKATLVTPTKPAQAPRIGLKNGSWFDECDSDNED